MPTALQADLMLFAYPAETMGNVVSNGVDEPINRHPPGECLLRRILA
jgi:hypothetical protein